MKLMLSWNSKHRIQDKQDRLAMILLKDKIWLCQGYEIGPPRKGQSSNPKIQSVFSISALHFLGMTTGPFPSQNNARIV